MHQSRTSALKPTEPAGLFPFNRGKLLFGPEFVFPKISEIMAGVAKERHKMDRSDPIRAKLQRANKHLAELRTAVKSFLDSAFVFETRTDDEKQEYSYYILSLEEFPYDKTAIIGDVLHNLRSALDQLAWQLVMWAGSKPTQNTSFPIFDDVSKYAAQCPGKLKGMRPNAIAAIDALKPYRTGNALLWQLHRLNIIDKHRVLITAASAMDMHSLTPSMRAKLPEIFAGSHPNEPMPDLREVLTPAPTLKFPLKAGELLLTTPKSEIEATMQFHFDVMFNEPLVVTSASVTETLKAFVDCVERVVSLLTPFLYT